MKKISILLALCLVCICCVQGQESVSGPSCIIPGSQYSYNLGGAASSFTYYVTNGTVPGGGGSGSCATHNCTVLVTWNTGISSGTVNLNSGSGNASETVTAATAFAPGTINSNGTQSINSGTIPATIGCPAATGGSCGTPFYTYQWQSSPNNVTYTAISGATLLNLAFSTGITSTTYYRRFVTETVSGNTGYSTVATVTVYPAIVPGSVSPSTQTINYHTNSSLLTLSGVSGGTNSYTYQWQSATTIGSWNNISGITSTTYTPTALTATSYFRVAVTSNGVTAYSSYAAVTVNPQVLPGVIAPTYIAITSGTSPGALTSSSPASGGACGGSFAYQWQSSTNGTTFTNITGITTLSYVPGNLSAGTWYRRQVTCGTDVEYSDTVQVIISSGTPDISFIRVRDILKPAVMDSAAIASLTSPYDVNQTTQYFDGLGRSLQTVAMQQSPLQKDMVSFTVYDALGRETNKYLPYVASTADGNFKATTLADNYSFNSIQFPSEQYYYAQTNFEPSPLNRPSLSMAPGINWTGSARGVGEQYQMNAVGDSVRYWTIAFPPGSLPATSAAYAASTLYKNITTDEAGHFIVEYKDMQGKVVLKKLQFATSPGTAHVGWLCTYYIYDDLDNLRFVIQPLGVQLINSSWSITTAIANELCFRYEYDYRKRMIIKKIPSTGETWMVYDARDRVAMTQDSAMRLAQKWLFTKYDTENRPDSVGQITDPTNYNNRLYHQGNASTSIYYPSAGSYTNEVLIQNFYDDYTWLSSYSTGLGSTMYHGDDGSFMAASNTTYPYPQALTQYNGLRGVLTGTRVEVLASSSQYLYSISFFDDRGRILQTQSPNFTGCTQLRDYQYSFSGQPLANYELTQDCNTTGPAIGVLTNYDYDHRSRVLDIKKTIFTTSGVGNTPIYTLVQNVYNELGQLQNKTYGNSVEAQAYAYNIRGWLTSINKNYVAGTASNYFGMELGYDKQTSAAPGNTYTTPAYNGNIEGTVWKSAGSAVNRKYDFVYDNVNRLTAANFTQYSGSAFDVSQGIDFTTNNLTYDANGNITTMNQKGFTVGGSSLIDQLTYTYQTGSNKLSQVTDAANNPTSLLGDFHYTGTKAAYDYTYDGNGSLKTDNNKAIDNIIYNYVNLPQQVHMNTKGNIIYTYDAIGNKLQKTVIDSAANKKTVTSYLGSSVYQYTSTLAGTGSDTLQFMNDEEGRIRWAYHRYTTGVVGYKFENDYFLKDHLGNTRMVLTQQRDTSNYLASMEAAYRTNENVLFGNLANTAYARASVPGYPASTTITNPNDSVSRVDYNGTTGQKTGPSLLIKVMSGDTINLAVQSYYNTNSVTTINSSFNDVLNSLASGIVNATGGAHGTLGNFTSSGSSVYTGVNTFLSVNEPPPVTGYPKAYLNWVFLDDQFNYINTLSGSVKASSSIYPAGTLNAVAPGAPVYINKSGYLYIWVSNETQGWDVFFDNLSVQHRQGPLLEENHYYPFGLTMAGISDKAIKTNYAENKYRFNGGNELQNHEFSDGSGLELYDAIHRMYDPQIGRLGQADPYAEIFSAWSPYAFANNNPTLLNDPLGLLSDSAHPQELAPVTVTAHKEKSPLFIETRPSKRNPNYVIGGNEPFYKPYTPGGTWDPEKTEQLATAVKIGVSIIPLSKGLKALYYSLKVFQRLKAESEIPESAEQVAENARNGIVQKGYKGGRTFENDGRGGGQQLPKTDANGNAITYKEYDVHPYQKGLDRGSERVVSGSDNRAYYTDDHYNTFTEIKK